MGSEFLWDYSFTLCIAVIAGLIGFVIGHSYGFRAATTGEVPHEPEEPKVDVNFWQAIYLAAIEEGNGPTAARCIADDAIVALVDISGVTIESVRREGVTEAKRLARDREKSNG